MSARAGFTLVELCVVMLVIALIAGVTTLAVGTLRPPAGRSAPTAMEWARAEAIRQGKPITVGTTKPVLFLPDGRAVGRDVNPWTGERRR
jgi:prepilin-type N-terminal cleavage/methylation domain-containing protein